MSIDTFNNRGDMVKHPNGEWVKASYAIMLETQLATANNETARLGRELEEARVALRSVKAPPGGLEMAIQQNDRNWAEAVVRTVVKPEDISRITTFVLDNRPAEIAAVFAALRAQADATNTSEGAD